MNLFGFLSKLSKNNQFQIALKSLYIKKLLYIGGCVHPLLRQEGRHGHSALPAQVNNKYIYKTTKQNEKVKFLLMPIIISNIVYLPYY